MSNQARRLLEEALDLPDTERAEIAASLIASLDDTDEAGAEEAWREEIARRLEEIRRGEVKTVPWDAVRDRLRQPRS
jgi:putative addiction module component (TIGR02574 family)